MMTSEQIFKTKLIERLEQDHRAAKLRNESFAEGTTEYSFNKATMLQAKVTLFDIKELSRDTNKMQQEINVDAKARVKSINNMLIFINKIILGSTLETQFQDTEGNQWFANELIEIEFKK